MGASGGFGFITFQNSGKGKPTKKQNAAAFMEGLDPSMYINTNPNTKKGIVEPKHLAMMAVVNMTLDLDGIQVNCGNLRVGHDGPGGAWWLGGTQCARNQVDNTPTAAPGTVQGIMPPTLYSVVCECDACVQIEHQQKDPDSL